MAKGPHSETIPDENSLRRRNRKKLHEKVTLLTKKKKHAKHTCANAMARRVRKNKRTTNSAALSVRRSDHGKKQKEVKQYGWRQNRTKLGFDGGDSGLENASTDGRWTGRDFEKNDVGGERRINETPDGLSVKGGMCQLEKSMALELRSARKTENKPSSS